MSQHKVQISSPLCGVFMDLSAVPDPVFAEKMVGDGFAIDPLDNKLYAPISGQIKTIHRAKHAITIASEHGFDLLIHIGLETVALSGAGFRVKVKEGDPVKAGDILSEFDLTTISEQAVALISPVIITDIQDDEWELEFLPRERVVAANTPVLYLKRRKGATPIDSQAPLSSADSGSQELTSAWITIINSHGIHARPAAQLNQVARAFPDHEILLQKGNNSANIKSLVAVLGLAIECQDQVRFVVRGANPQAIISQLTSVLHNLKDEESPAHEPEAQRGGMTDSQDCYHGVVAAPGLAIGYLQQVQRPQFEYVETSSDSQQELTQLEQALAELTREFASNAQHLTESNSTYKSILAAHQMIIADPELKTSAVHYIQQGASAAAAWARAVNDACAILAKTGNRLVGERQADLLDVRDQLIVKLGAKRLTTTTLHGEQLILVSEDFTPSQVMDLPAHVCGLVSVHGGATSHAAILARTKGIPYLVAVQPSILGASAEEAILDSNTSSLNLRPSASELAAAKAALLRNSQQLAKAQADAKQAAVTQDGHSITCLANIAAAQEMTLALANGGQGVGLFRTEFMFLETAQPLSEDEQYAHYLALSQQAHGQAVVIRTLDAGGDKQIPYLEQKPEANPMLGLRGIRLSLANRQLLKTQLRAIVRTQDSSIKIMLPMVSQISEYREVRQLLTEVKAELGITTPFQLGIMVEVPAVALLSATFAAEVDFMSIGTNDLTQYLLAIDREHTALAREVDHLHPAVLQAIAIIVAGVRQHNCPLSVCGLLATEKLALPILIGLGITNLSMSIANLAENKAFIRSLNLAECQAHARHVLSLASAQEVRDYLSHHFN